jgi:hypothetical protein
MRKAGRERFLYELEATLRTSSAFSSC